MEEVHDVFVYGPELDPEVMHRRLAASTGPVRAVLRGWALLFDRITVERDGTGEANVAPDPAGVVEGALYGVSRRELPRADAAFGHPARTSRRMLAVEREDGSRVPAWVYVATPDWRQEGLLARAEDVRRLAGAKLLSAAYRAALEARFGARHG